MRLERPEEFEKLRLKAFVKYVNDHPLQFPGGTAVETSGGIEMRAIGIISIVFSKRIVFIILVEFADFIVVALIFVCVFVVIVFLTIIKYI